MVWDCQVYLPGEDEPTDMAGYADYMSERFEEEDLMVFWAYYPGLDSQLPSTEISRA